MIFNGLPLGNEGGAASGVLGGNGSTAGLADYGTRFQAVFNNIPSGVSIYVSTTNVTTITQNNGVQVFPTAPAGSSTVSSYAQLIVSSTASETVLNTAPDAVGHWQQRRRQLCRLHPGRRNQHGYRRLGSDQQQHLHQSEL